MNEEQRAPSTPARRDAPEEIFADGGEMGALLRAHDWSATPLGPVSGWSHALRTTVGLLLRNRFPLLLWWGPRFVQIYNDAYAPILGVKHPDRALAKPVSECWEEIWDVIGPMIEAPFRGEPATWSDDLELLLRRNGFSEEAHFKFAYSPVPDESVPSRIGGVLATVAETTVEVYGRRQLATLGALARQAADAKTALEACAMAARTLEADTRDIPCAFFYLVDEGKTARLVSTTGVADASSGLPPTITRDDDAGAWPVWRVMREGRAEVVDLGALKLPCGAWQEAPRKAILLPLASPEQAQVYGVLVVALSPHREFNEQYETFIDLAAEHVTSAIRNARAYEQERERAERLSELDRAKTAFFSNVSHEFRTPLTLILGPLEDALSSPEHALAGENLETAHRNALRLLKLVNTLLEFSRIEAGRVQAAYEKTDLGSFTAELASVFRSAVARAELRYVVETTDAVAYVDRDMWEKIVLNLLSNALKFTFEGEIAIGVCTREGHVILTVRDTGTGVPPGEVSHLFKRFHRVRGAKARTHEGSGIGLALVNELVKLHGGDVRVESVEDRGTQFYVRIPTGSDHLPPEQVMKEGALSRGAVGAAPYVEEALRWLPAAPPASQIDRAAGDLLENMPTQHEPASERILLVDDNVDMRSYVSKLLAPHWRVEAVGDGLAALEAIRRERPALVVSDVMMPRLDGFGLLRQLRADAATSTIPVMLLSARAGEESTAEGFRAGADDYLIKPFGARELLARVSAQISSSKARQAERRRLLALLEQLPAIVNFLRGPNLVFDFVHPMATAALGGRELIGRPILEAMPELHGQPYYAYMRRVFDTGQPFRQTEAETRLMVDGKEVTSYWDSVYQAVRNESGGIEGVMTFDLDVTQAVLTRRELEQAGRAKDEAVDRLRKSDRAKDEFLATVSHELRTPLNAMLGWAKLLASVDRHDIAKIDRGLAVIERNAHARLIDDLMDVSRIISGKLSLAMKSVGLASVINAAADVVRPAAEGKAVRLLVELSADLGTMVGDADRLQQVVWNRLSNAVRFTPARGLVTVSAGREGSHVKIRVVDTGAGIAPEHLPHIFDRFRQVDSSTTRAHGGLGLGLAIVRHLVEGHGGTVSVSSEGEGKGATFTVSLPIRAVARPLDHDGEAKAETHAAPSLAERTQTTLEGVRALVVDDDQDSLDLLRVVLEAAGASVTTVTGAREALSVRGSFDVIISDIGMPEVDGYDFIRGIRSQDDPAAATTPAIALTAYARQDDADRAVRAGYQEHLTKPVDAERLLETVKTWARVRTEAG